MIQPNPLQSLPTQSNTPHSNQTESYPIKPIQSNPKPHTLINHNPNNSNLSQSNHLPSPPFHSLCITIPSADLSVYRFVLWPMSTMAEPSMSLRMCVWWPPIPAEKQSTGLCVEWCVVTTLLTHTFLKNDRSDFVSNCVWRPPFDKQFDHVFPIMTSTDVHHLYPFEYSFPLMCDNPFFFLQSMYELTHTSTSPQTYEHQ